MAALASALLLPGCSQPVEVGGKSPAGAPADQPEPGAPAQAPAGEEIAPPEPDQTPPPASNEEPRREPPPTDSPDQPVAAADNLDAFFGAKDEPDEDDRYSAATPPAMAKPGEEPTLWKPQDGAAADEPQGVSDFFGDIMEPADEAAADPKPSSADSASPSPAETEKPLASIPGAGDAPADTEELNGNQESLDDFFGVEPAAPAEQPPAAEESLDALPEIELPMAEPEPKPEVRPEADSPVPTVSPLPEWTPERPTAPAPEETLPQEPPAPSPEPEPPTATTSPFELPPPQLAAPPAPAPEASQPAATPGLPTDLLRPAPKRPTFDATNTRLLAWQLGSKLGLLTADASPPAWETDALAETLGIQAVELDASGDPSKATSRLLKSAGVLGERLARRHGADHAALLEIAVKSNALVALLGQHPKLAGPVAGAIEQAAGRSGLDSQLVTPFVEVLRSDPTPEQAREAVFNLHEAVAQALEAGQ